MEIRKKLSDVQFTQLANAQLQYDKALKVLQKAQETLDLVSLLVFDSHGVPTTSKVNVDTSTKELIITE